MLFVDRIVRARSLLRSPTIIWSCLVVVFILAIVLIATSAGTRLSRSQNPEIPPREKRLEWFVARAKAKGQPKISVPAPTIEYLGSSGSTTLDKALSAYTAVVATPTTMRSYLAPDSEDIVTWIRFDTREVLTQADKPACPACEIPQAPEEFSSVGDNQFVLSKIGGTVTIDGVTVTMNDPDFPDFEVGKDYLLFISRYPSGVAVIGLGPGGVLKAAADGKLEGISQKTHRVKSEIDEKLNSSRRMLKEHVKALRSAGK